MILLRLEKIGGINCDIEGGQPQYLYNKSDIGWMPIESMTFGFNSSSDAKGGGANKGVTGIQAGDRQGAQPRQSAPIAGANSSGGSGEEAFSEIQISRFVDTVTPQLMAFAMEDRRKKKGDGSKLRKADIHFLHSVMGLNSDKSLRTVFPYLMITLEDVLVASWSITGSGDDRPTESLQLKYDKAAMKYFRTKTGKDWIGGHPAGWDQLKNDFWPQTETDKIEYFKSPVK